MTRFVETVKLGFSDPVRMFSSMPEENIGPPVLFGVIVGTIVSVIGCVYQILFGGLAWMGGARAEEFAASTTLFILLALVTTWLVWLLHSAGRTVRVAGRIPVWMQVAAGTALVAFAVALVFFRRKHAAAVRARHDDCLAARLIIDIVRVHQAIEVELRRMVGCAVLVPCLPNRALLRKHNHAMQGLPAVSE